MTATGRSKEAKNALKKVAAVNKKMLPEQFFSSVEFMSSNNVINSSEKRKKTMVDMMKMPCLRRIFILTNLTWIFTSLCFTGGYIYAATVSANPFVMITANAAIDILANAIADRLAEKYGRRATIVLTCSASALAYLSSAAVPSDAFVARMASLILGRLAMTVGYNVNYLYAAEVYPTVVRTQALAVRQAFGSIGNFLSPQVVLLALYAKYLPLMVFGSISAMAAMAMLSLPETVNKKLPETLEDGEAMGKEKTFDYSFCCKGESKLFQQEEKGDTSYVTKL